LAQEQAWASGLIGLMNGTASGGFAVASGKFGPSSDWWAFGYFPGSNPDPDGLCGNASCTTLNSGQETYWSGLAYFPAPVTAPLVPWVVMLQ
jgi:hypothetical protein